MHGNNLPKVKQQNEESIKALLYRCGPLARAEIAAQLDLTPPTITNIVGEMIAAGVIHELPAEADAAPHGVGRKPIRVDFVPEARLALGISLGRDRTHYCITDLRGHMLAQGTEPVMPEEYEEMVPRLLALVARIRAAYPELWARLPGIGLVMPGVVDPHRGVLTNNGSERPGWIGQPLADTVSEAAGLPVRMENNVRGRTCAVTLFHPEIVADCPTFAFCHVSWGIACPIVLRSSSYCGEDYAAGEIGHMIMERGGPALKNCGLPGSLESFSSTRAILERCRQALCSGQPTSLRDLCPDPAQLTLEQVLMVQAQGDVLVNRILEDAITYVGIALANITAFLKPCRFVIGGPLFRYAPNVETLRRSLRENSFLAADTDFQLVPLDLGEYGGASGAAAVCLEKFFLRG